MKPLPNDPSALPPYDRATLGFYAGQARIYAASARSGPSRNLSAFLELLRPGARILELGCGDGRDSETMLAHGFDVDATDGCESMAKQAEARLGRSVRVMRFDQLVLEQAYDGVWANACLLHVPRPALKDVLSRIFTALRPGGVHFASYKAGDREGRDGLGRYFNYLSTEELKAVYRRSAPWTLLSVESQVGGDYQGGKRPWAAITVRRPE